MRQEALKIPFLLSHATRLLTRHADASLNELGLTAAQIPVLHALKEGRAGHQKELAALMEVEQPAMAELLGRMERDKLIHRTTDPADRRSRRVELSALAKRKIGPAQLALQAGLDVALAGLTRQEVEQLSRLLGRLVSSLE